MKANINNIMRIVVGCGMAASLCSCTAMSNMMNPFYESPKPVALLGEKSDKAINGQQSQVDAARAALEARASYQRVHTAKPDGPVMDPAIVRLMWIPDHLNQHGDLVPAHYYYLKVMEDHWAVTDAFELQAQLDRSQGSGPELPYVNVDDKIK